MAVVSDDESDKILSVVYFVGMAVALVFFAIVALFVAGWLEALVALAIAALAIAFALNRRRDESSISRQGTFPDAGPGENYRQGRCRAVRM